MGGPLQRDAAERPGLSLAAAPRRFSLSLCDQWVRGGRRTTHRRRMQRAPPVNDALHSCIHTLNITHAFPYYCITTRQSGTARIRHTEILILLLVCVLLLLLCKNRVTVLPGHPLCRQQHRSWIPSVGGVQSRVPIASLSALIPFLSS